MRTSLRTTTAILASLSLVAPSVLTAQTEGQGSATEACVADPANCDPAALAQDLAEQLGATNEAEDPAVIEDPAGDAEAAEAATAEPEAAGQAEADAAAQAEQQAADQAAADAAAQAEQQAADQAAADAAAQAEQQAADQAAADAAAQAEQQAADQAAADAAAQAEQQAAAEDKADAAAQAEQQAAAQAEAEAAAQAEQQAAEAEAVTTAEQNTAADEQPAQVVQTETPPAQDAEEAPAATAAAPAQEPAQDAQAGAESPASPAPEAGTQAAQAQPGGGADDSRSIAQQLATGAAALLAGDTDAGQVVEETVTEETARSSDEDFTGAINATAPETASAPQADGGLSSFEKALLVGAGALAVGAIIRGNREVVSTAPDRVVVSSSEGDYQVLKDDNALLRQPGNQVQTRTFDDGSTRTVTTREDGSQVITIRDAELRVVRRSLVRADGSEVMLIDDTEAAEPVDIATLPQPAPQYESTDQDALRAALEREGAFSRRFTLAQVRQIKEVRNLAPAIEVESIQFETGSAAIRPDEARKLADLGQQIVQAIDANPGEIFLVEGHTDAVGSAVTNLILSDRRAESLALALTEYFDVPPENLVVQGYGESDLKVAVETAEPENRRAELRRITPLLQVASN